MLPVHINIAVMLTGYLLVMAYLGLGLLLHRRRPTTSWAPARRSLLRRSGGAGPHWSGT
jgi:hypothetical protein